MKITVEVPDEKVIALVSQRIAELFSNDARFRESSARDMIRSIVDAEACAMVSAARDKIAGELLEYAKDSVRVAMKDAIDAAAKRGIGALKKLYAGFDPARITPDQRAWLEKQISEAAGKTQ